MAEDDRKKKFEEIWLRMYVAAMSSSSLNPNDWKYFADRALNEFKERFD